MVNCRFTECSFHLFVFHLVVSLPDLRDHDAYIPLNDVNPRTNTVANIVGTGGDCHCARETFLILNVFRAIKL